MAEKSNVVIPPPDYLECLSTGAATAEKGDSSLKTSNHKAPAPKPERTPPVSRAPGAPTLTGRLWGAGPPPLQAGRGWPLGGARTGSQGLAILPVAQSFSLNFCPPLVFISSVSDGWHTRGPSFPRLCPLSSFPCLWSCLQSFRPVITFLCTSLSLHTVSWRKTEVVIESPHLQELPGTRLSVLLSLGLGQRP